MSKELSFGTLLSLALWPKSSLRSGLQIHQPLSEMAKSAIKIKYLKEEGKIVVEMDK